MIYRNKKEMLSFAEQFLAYNCEGRKEYIQKFEELAKEEAQKADEVKERICPRCGKPLVLRTTKKGSRAGEQFYGCSGFPKCRYLEQL